MSQQPHLSFGPRAVGHAHPCFIIAEAGVNHNGDLDIARRLIDVAAEAGADAVKFQTFRTDRLAARSAAKAAYQRETTDADESQAAMLARLELSPESHEVLIAHCRDKGIMFMSTPFDEESADLLHRLGVPGFKISSGDLTNLPFLAHVARLGLPMIISTGMATLGEVEEAVRTIETAGCSGLAILHCVSSYPAETADVNLRAMQTLRDAFRHPVGYSDHTLGIEVSLAAVALGACVIEKHFTLDTRMAGPDHRASLEPAWLASLVAGIRTVEQCLGDGVKRPRPVELGVAAVARKSLFWADDLARGEAVTAGSLIALRPSSGLHPRVRDSLVGRRLARPVRGGEPVREADLEEPS